MLVIKKFEDTQIIKNILSDILSLNNTVDELSKQEQHKSLFEDQNKKITLLEASISNYKLQLDSELKDLNAVKNLTIEIEDRVSNQASKLNDLEKNKIEKIKIASDKIIKDVEEIKKTLQAHSSRLEAVDKEKVIIDLSKKMTAVSEELIDYKRTVDMLKKDSDFIGKKVFEDCEKTQTDLVKSYESLQNLIKKNLEDGFSSYDQKIKITDKEIRDEIQFKLSENYLKMDAFMNKYANAFGKLPNIENDIISLKSKIYNETFLNELKERPLIQKIDKMIEKKFNREHIRLKNGTPKPYFVENMGSLSATDKRLAQAWNDFAKKTIGTNKNTYLDPTRVMHYDERMSEDEWSWQKNINRGLTAHIDTSYLFKQNLLVKCV